MKSIVFSILLGSCLVPSVQAQNYVSRYGLPTRVTEHTRIRYYMPITPIPMFAV